MSYNIRSRKNYRFTWPNSVNSLVSCIIKLKLTSNKNCSLIRAISQFHFFWYKKNPHVIDVRRAAKCIALQPKQERKKGLLHNSGHYIQHDNLNGNSNLVSTWIMNLLDVGCEFAWHTRFAQESRTEWERERWV